MLSQILSLIHQQLSTILTRDHQNLFPLIAHPGTLERILALNLDEIQLPLAPFGPPRVYYAPGTLPRWALHNARDFTPESAKRPAEGGIPILIVRFKQAFTVSAGL
uniref:Uncharacterized protein n=1 Tax=Timema bartmani TaxID=61472 RepID=A0A7R9I545_9NEOP|nr:unnamed protein product [Timema bartmani]